jgi:PKD repeat protein
VDFDLAHSPVGRTALAVAIAIVSVAIALVPSNSPAAVKGMPADFGWSPAVPTPGQVVTFTAAVNPPAGVEVKNYDWDLNGDGRIDQHGQTAIWSYAAPGTVTVRLAVRGSGNHRADVSHTVSIQSPPNEGGGGGVGPPAPKPPVASFTIAPAAPVVNQPVLFTSTSRDPDGTIKDQVWDLNGDGNYDNGGGAAALRTFADPGEYAIGLRVTDDSGLVSFDSQTLTVSSAHGGAGGSAAAQKSGPRLLSPFPVVRIAGRVTSAGTRVRLLRVTAPVGAKVSVRCSGLGCPFKKQVRGVESRARSLRSVGVRIRSLERLLFPGVRVRLYITKGGAIGKYSKFRFRVANPPVRTDSCLMPGSWSPTECPVL